MSHRKRLRRPPFSRLAKPVADKLKAPLAVVLGSPAEVIDFTGSLPFDDITCYQMDLFQAQRLAMEASRPLRVETLPDLWDLPADFQTVVYPVPYAGERHLKIDMVEQAFHILRPQGNFVVLSPYDRDDFFPPALKKVFGKVHAPMKGDNNVFWCQKSKERTRRRHEMTFQVQAGDGTSLRFLSRPGVFSYGSFDDGARALVEVMEIDPGDRVLDLGCGCGTNGIFASRRTGPEGFVAFADSNVRAIELTRINAENMCACPFETLASHTLEDLQADSYDVVIANPPYFAQLGIAQLFIERAHAVLKPGGRLFLVSKQIEAIGQSMVESFEEASLIDRRGYVIFCAEKNITDPGGTP